MLNRGRFARPLHTNHGPPTCYCRGHLFQQQAIPAVRLLRANPSRRLASSCQTRQIRNGGRRQPTTPNCSSAILTACVLRINHQSEVIWSGPITHGARVPSVPDIASGVSVDTQSMALTTVLTQELRRRATDSSPRAPSALRCFSEPLASSSEQGAFPGLSTAPVHW